MMNVLLKILQNSITYAEWERVGIRTHHGVALPLFSLHSERSCGIGEFLDLLPLLEWCHKIGFDVIQLLPINDSGNDPSPYNALSSCALNPLYLSLEILPYLSKHSDLRAGLRDLKRLNQTSRVAYGIVKSHKISWLRHYFEQTSEKLIKSASFIEFIEKNSWVKPYALFKTLKDHLEQTSWQTWPQEFQNLSEQALDSLIEHYWKDASFYMVLQYLCFEQLCFVRAFAKKLKILLKGDIPILISPESADVWYHSTLFDLSLAAGAPPDTYNPKGQYWGFPLFNWDAHKKENYRWWKERLSSASNYYDLYRIDHVVGFFRIWGIPLEGDPKEGKFYPDIADLWIPQGRSLLQMMIDECPMLPIAEDLGTIPDGVRTCLKELGICGTKVMRWERYWEEDRRFIPYREYNPISMTCVSTHDSETLAGWWRAYPEEAKAFAAFKNWQFTPFLGHKEQEEILRDSHHTASLFHINLLQEYLALFPDFVSEDPSDERINIPGKILETNWTYRFRPSVEKLNENLPLQEMMRSMINHRPFP
ncbi:MAG: 4-alpha-glucanotransferase [Anaerolineae bacterium]